MVAEVPEPRLEVEFYNTPEEKQTIKRTRNRAGWHTLHVDYIDSRGNPTDGTSGKITFRDIEPFPSTQRLRLKALEQKRDARTLTTAEINEYLDLRHNIIV